MSGLITVLTLLRSVGEVFGITFKRSAFVRYRVIEREAAGVEV